MLRFVMSLLFLLSMTCLVLATSPVEPDPGAPATAPEPSAPDNADDDAEDTDQIHVWQVTTVSKKAEPIWRAPGVASAISVDEIEAFGAPSLGEIWAHIPGVQNSFGTGINRTSIRGGDPNASIFHTLVLVDGRPVRTSGGNLSAYSPPYTIPTLQVERVEVSRGPGSVMYGTNAFEGVLNIITRKNQENGFRALIEGGSFGTNKGEIAGAYAKGDFSFNAGFLFSDIDGWGFESAAVTGGTFSKDVVQENRGLNANIKYKNLELSVFHGDLYQFALFALIPDDILFFDSQVSMFDLSYEHLIGSWKLEFHFTQNHEDFAWLFGDTPVLPFQTTDLLAEAIAFGSVGAVDITTGVVLQRLDTETDGGSVSTAYEGDTVLYSLYGQLQYRPNDYLDLTAGVQVNQVDNIKATFAGAPANVPTDFDADVVPRLGVIWNFNPSNDGSQHGVKMLYGEAFRSPGLLEYVIDTPGIQGGNPNLVPETIDTWDLQFFSHGSKYEASLGFYSSVQKDLILFVPNEEYVLGEAQNVARLESEGVEFESKYRPSSRFYAQFAYTWQDSEEKSGLSQASVLPSTNWKLGLGYTSPRLNLSLFNQHDGAYKEDTLAPPVAINPPSEAVDIVNVNCDWKIMNEAFGHRWNISLNLRGQNLLDEEIWIPDFLAHAANTVPGGPGRSFYATLKLAR